MSYISTATVSNLRVTRKYGWFERLERLIRYRLHIPLKRSVHSLAHTARGVMIGVIWALTPLFGVQMIGVFGTWIAARKLLKWDFSLLNGMAWTWTTNVFTVIPAYYVSYLTGQVMLGRFNHLSGYDNFTNILKLLEEGDWQAMASDIGLPLAIGWIPWAILSGWVAYILSYKFVVRYRAQRKVNMQRAKNRS